MENNENNTAIGWDENASILPEGGWDDLDVTSDVDDPEAERIAEGISQAYDAQTAGQDEGIESQTESESEVPTTEPQAAETDDGEDEEDAAPTIEQELMRAVEKPKVKFTAKVDHELKDVELDESELPTVYQKAHNFERVSKRAKESQEKLNEVAVLAAELGYDSVDDLIKNARENNRNAIIQDITDKGNSEDVAEFVADARLKEARGKAHTVTDEDDLPAASASAAPTRNYQAEVADFLSAHPEYREKGKKIPAEVIEATKSGVTLRTAYAEWEANNARAENARVKQERDVNAQRAEAASRAPVRGVTNGNASAKEEAADPWLAGFKGKSWWE